MADLITKACPRLISGVGFSQALGYIKVSIQLLAEELLEDERGDTLKATDLTSACDLVAARSFEGLSLSSV